MASNDNASDVDFGFGFNNINFSDRVLRIEIEREEDKVTHPKKRTKMGHQKRTKKGNIEVKTIHINSIVLAAKSPFFFKLFSNGMKESEERHATLKIHLSQEVALMDLLNFMYSTTLSSETTSSLLDVLMVADKFQVSSCMRYCTQLLSNLPMTCESALEFLNLPSTVLMAHEIQTLVDAANKYLVDCYKDFTKFKDELLKLPLDVIEVVFSSDDLKVTSEDDVYDFVLKWTKKHYPTIKKRREILTTRLGSLIRFKYMTCQKLKEILACNDFDPAFASKVVLDALFFKAESPDLQSLRVVERAHKYWPWPVKVIESKFPHPHCILYLHLKKEECENLLPSQRVVSNDFRFEGNTFCLVAERSTKDNNNLPSDCFGLFLSMRVSESSSSSCSVASVFSARIKPAKKFVAYLNLNLMLTAGGSPYGYRDLFTVSWSQFIAEDSVYFINGVLHLKVEVKMNL